MTTDSQCVFEDINMTGTHLLAQSINHSPLGFIQFGIFFTNNSPESDVDYLLQQMQHLQASCEVLKTA